MIDRGDASAKREMRNTLKMWTYLAFQLLEGFENDVSRPGVMEVQEKVGASGPISHVTALHDQNGKVLCDSTFVIVGLSLAQVCACLLEHVIAVIFTYIVHI